MQKDTGIGIFLLCKESHISTRTYYKIMRYENVKYECYHRLFVGLCHAADDIQFMEHWKVLGEGLFWNYSEE